MRGMDSLYRSAVILSWWRKETGVCGKGQGGSVRLALRESFSKLKTNGMAESVPRWYTPPFRRLCFQLIPSRFPLRSHSSPTNSVAVTFLPNKIRKEYTCTINLQLHFISFLGSKMWFILSQGKKCYQRYQKDDFLIQALKFQAENVYVC